MASLFPRMLHTVDRQSACAHPKTKEEELRKKKMAGQTKWGGALERALKRKQDLFEGSPREHPLRAESSAAGCVFLSKVRNSRTLESLLKGDGPIRPLYTTFPGIQVDGMFAVLTSHLQAIP